MIPKIIHYVWLGGKPMSPLGERCLESWKRHLPGWEIKRWDESNSPMGQFFVAKMMKGGKVAFASDYIRLHALLESGGLYLDTDVEIFRDPGEMVEGTRLILGFHSVQNRLWKCALATCWIAAPQGFSLLRSIHKRYEALDRAVMNNTFFTEEILPLFGNRALPPGGRFPYLENASVRIYHRDYFGSQLGIKSVDATVDPVAMHYGTGDWGGRADPLPWWRRFYDMRLDRKVLRPIEGWVKKIRNHAPHSHS